MGSDAEWQARSSAVFSAASIQTCLRMKVLFGMVLRQATGFVESLLQLVGLDRKVTAFSILCRHQQALVVDIASRRSSAPLLF